MSCYRSWKQEDLERLLYFDALFNKLWKEEHPKLTTIPLINVQTEIRNRFPVDSEYDLIQSEFNLTKEFFYSEQAIDKRIKEKYEAYILNEGKKKVSLPGNIEIRDYQKRAYENWVNNNFKGLFAMATGTGKTITAINCILEEYKKNGYHRVIITVPTKSLVQQWEGLILNVFNFSNVINTSTDRSWEKKIRRFLSALKANNECDFILITTYSQLKKNKLQGLLNQYQQEFESVILIADEAHTLGSPGAIANLPISISRRIGLSATPQRRYDSFGTSEIENFFNSYPPEYTINYSMKKAIDDEMLCEFEYYPRFVSLTDHELEEYDHFTQLLRPYIDSVNGAYLDTPRAKELLILRKNIIHKAQNKLDLLRSIINEIGVSDFKNAFVYVPEGYEPDYWNEDDYSISQEDIRIIDKYSKLLGDTGLVVKNFLGGTEGRDNILRLFSKGKYDVLLAMKCLDEGVDITRTEYAVFCASTGNPRQFIQRRGRVLRTHPEKRFAKIYDMIVAPSMDGIAVLDENQREVEKRIFRNELLRVINFLALARNSVDLVHGEFGTKCEENCITNLPELIMEELRSYETAYENT